MLREDATPGIVLKSEGIPIERDYEKLIEEILVHLRGNYTKAQLSRKLKVSSTQYYHWESGHSAISWIDFVTVCEALRAPLTEALARFLAYQGKAFDVPTLIDHLSGKQTQAKIAQSLGVSKSVISKWKNSTTTPSLRHVLQMIDGGAFSLADFIYELIGRANIESLKYELTLKRDEKRMNYQAPWVAALLLYLRTEEYQRFESHPDGYLAKKLGVSFEDEKESLSLLLESGLIEQRGNLFSPTTRQLNTLGDREGGRQIRKYWASRVLNYLEDSEAYSNNKNNLCGYLVFNTTPEMEIEIRKKYLEFYQEIDSMVKSVPSGSSRVNLLNIQIIDVASLPKGSSKQK